MSVLVDLAESTFGLKPKTRVMKLPNNHPFIYYFAMEMVKGVLFVKVD